MDEFIVISKVFVCVCVLGLVGVRNVVLNKLYRSICILGLALEVIYFVSKFPL